MLRGILLKSFKSSFLHPEIVLTVCCTGMVTGSTHIVVWKINNIVMNGDDTIILINNNFKSTHCRERKSWDVQIKFESTVQIYNKIVGENEWNNAAEYQYLCSVC